MSRQKASPRIEKPKCSRCLSYFCFWPCGSLIVLQAVETSINGILLSFDPAVNHNRVNRPWRPFVSGMSWRTLLSRVVEE